MKEEKKPRVKYHIETCMQHWYQRFCTARGPISSANLWMLLDIAAVVLNVLHLTSNPIYSSVQPEAFCISF